MKKGTTLWLFVPLVILALSFAYYLVIFLPNKHRTEQELESKKIQVEQERQKSQESAQQAKNNAVAECVTDLRESYASGQIDDAGIYTVQDARDYIDSYVKTCTRLKGFSPD